VTECIGWGDGDASTEAAKAEVQIQILVGLCYS